MDKFEIGRRSFSEAQVNRRQKLNREYDDPETLNEMYWGEQMTQREIADALGCSQLSVQKGMERNNIEVRKVGVDGEVYQTERGELVRSSGEKEIANWLYERNIDYTYEPKNIFDSMIPDFLVSDKCVEYWGMVAFEDYRERMAEKKEIYNESNEELIDLYPSDLDNLEKKLGFINF